ncbi:MAG: helix-turn-helix domain-containing protein [Pseudomonadota bacterium]|nr:helix-turn-helix domain-containing protein [Pseudomonadota bacterium]
MPAPPDLLPAFLRFAPVPVKARRNGWTSDLQLRFVIHLARGAGVDEAARQLGRSRQSAYRLRRRSGADGFAAVWDAAVDFAREVRAAPSLPGASRSGIETLLVPRFYRGRLIGFVQRDDTRGLMAHIGRLDRIADRLEERGAGQSLQG